MNATDLPALNNRLVLVYSDADRRNPPSGRRGTLFVHEEGGGRPEVSVEIEFPEMFTSRAHRRRIVLTEEQVDQLLQTEHYGAYTVKVAGRLDPSLAPGNE